MRKLSLKGSMMSGSAAVALAIFAAPGVVAAQTATYSFNIPAQDLGAALRAYGRASRQQLVFNSRDTRGRRSAALVGTFSADAGLNLLLVGTGLSVQRGSSGVLVVTDPRRADAAADEARSGGVSRDGAVPEIEVSTPGIQVSTLPEILVTGEPSFNVDIRRSEDAALPYAVFGSEEIQSSQASSIGDFLRSRLPMNHSPASGEQQVGFATGTRSTIDLRGLGRLQTLVLVDGRRQPSVPDSVALDQADVNGIPLSAIERIEVLPSSAGAIYGGSANGGVVNIVLKRDYRGLELTTSYGQSFRGDAGRVRFDASGGLTFNDGKTRIMVSGSWSDSDPLYVGDRSFGQRARDLQATNNPDFFLTGYNPPASYTSNIRSFDGSNLVLDSGAALNSPITFVPEGYAGPRSDGGAALAANAGRYNLRQAADLNGTERSLLNEPQTAAYAVSVRHDFNDRLQVYSELSWVENNSSSQTGGESSSTLVRADAPNNPFTTDIYVSFPSPNVAFEAQSDSHTFRGLIGAIVKLPFNWTSSVEFVGSRSETFSSGTSSPFLLEFATDLENGVLDVLADLNQAPLSYEPYLGATPNYSDPSRLGMKDYTVRLAGPLFRLPAGEIGLSILGEWREEELKRSVYYYGSYGNVGRDYYGRESASQRVASAYIEARVPIVGPAMDVPLISSLDLQLSIRHDDYRTIAPLESSSYLAGPEEPFPTVATVQNEFASTDYLVGIVYAPVPELKIRGSYATGFLPPIFGQITLVTINNFPFRFVDDPLRGGSTGPGVGGEGPVTLVLGGNPNLLPENSESISAGMIWTPSWAAGLRLSLDYTQIQKTDEIQNLEDRTYILAHPELFPGRVVRGPNRPGDPTGWLGPVTFFDSSAVNLAKTAVEAFDLQIDYARDISSVGQLRWFAVATYQPRLEQTIVEGTPTIERVGALGQPLEWKATAGMVVDRGPWTFQWNTQYYGSEGVRNVYLPWETAINIASQGSDEIPEQIYHDAFLTYRFGDLSVLRNGILSVGIQNVFDTNPPIIASALSGSFGYSTYGDPRLRRFTISLRTSF